jgi:hypothetical protein
MAGAEAGRPQTDYKAASSALIRARSICSLHTLDPDDHVLFIGQNEKPPLSLGPMSDSTSYNATNSCARGTMRSLLPASKR